LADGIGGRPHGAQASTVAIFAAASALRHFRDTFEAIDETRLRTAFAAAHKAVSDLNSGLSHADAMGTTLSVAIVTEDQFIAGNVGDSRIYLVSPHSMTSTVAQISRDHSRVDELSSRYLASGSMSRGALTQAIGIGRIIEPHIVSGALVDRDALILCSDGVSDYVNDGAIVSISLSLHRNPEKMANSLIQTALTNGGGDNCTCICIGLFAEGD